jgi:glycosyltransferase involved in cell wall biosynthesis
LLARPGPVVPPENARLLCAELFDDVSRAEYYQAHATTAYWLVYDFLPWLRPEWFPAGPANRLMPFLHALRSVSHRAFISAATKREYAERILRGPCNGPVLPLGADGLGLARQSFDRARRDIVMLGTIEARKNAASAVRAFQRLWSEGIDARLVLIGAVEQDALEEQALLRALAPERRLVQLGAVPDEAVREALAQARVLLFPSEGEGYGLPPMEALYSGIPVIVSDALPALEGLPSLGQIRLRSADPPAIAAAVRSVLDDGVARSLWADAARFSLPSWRDFAGAVSAWISAAGPRDPTRS